MIRPAELDNFALTTGFLTGGKKEKKRSNRFNGFPVVSSRRLLRIETDS